MASSRKIYMILMDYNYWCINVHPPFNVAAGKQGDNFNDYIYCWIAGEFCPGIDKVLLKPIHDDHFVSIDSESAEKLKLTNKCSWVKSKVIPNEMYWCMTKGDRNLNIVLKYITWVNVLRYFPPLLTVIKYCSDNF